MAANKLTEEHLIAARLAHLGMIQGIISRMSGYSANAKNFCLTVLAALIGISFQYHITGLGWAAGFVLVVFAMLDVYYLAQERRFRALYEEVVTRPLTNAAQLSIQPNKLTFSDYASGVRSFSTGGFYLLLLAFIIVILSVSHDLPKEARLDNDSRSAGAEHAPSFKPPVGVPAGPGTDGGHSAPASAADNARGSLGDDTASSTTGTATLGAGDVRQKSERRTVEQPLRATRSTGN